MAKTTVRLWRDYQCFVDIESTEVLSIEEKEIVTQVLAQAFYLCLFGFPAPSPDIIERELDTIQPNLSQKISALYFHY